MTLRLWPEPKLRVQCSTNCPTKVPQLELSLLVKPQKLYKLSKWILEMGVYDEINDIQEVWIGWKSLEMLPFLHDQYQRIQSFGCLYSPKDGIHILTPKQLASCHGFGLSSWLTSKSRKGQIAVFVEPPEQGFWIVLYLLANECLCAADLLSL